MRRQLNLLPILLSLCAFAQNLPINRHIIGLKEPLTAPSGRAPQEIARDFLRTSAAAIGLTNADLGSAYVARQYMDAHNGVTHILYRQQFQGVDVYNSA